MLVSKFNVSAPKIETVLVLHVNLDLESASTTRKQEKMDFKKKWILS